MVKGLVFAIALSGALFTFQGLGQVAPESQAAPKIEVLHNVVMKTRDGVSLRADIYRPLGSDNSPVLLQRTPYNKASTTEFGHSAAEHGYLVVVQDVRGRYASDGEWYPFKFESNDGYDTVEWAAGLAGSNGKVGMFGGSYVGATQMLAAISHPPHLAGICPVVTASNYHENWTYQGGAFEQWFNESWTSGLAQDTFDRLIRGNTNAVTGTKMLPLKSYPLFNVKLPVSPESLAHEIAPYFEDWLDHPLYDSYWKQWAIEEQYSSIEVPALTVTAWYDIFQGGSLRNYEGLKVHAANQNARSQQKLLITIGGHAGAGRKIGSVDFGVEAAKYDELNVTLEWYDYLLLGKKNLFTTEKPVKIFVMGENQWRSEDSWPLERAKQTSYFLHSGGKANTASGDGSISLVTAKHDPSDRYMYDPANPVPTTGGPLCCDSEHLAPGPMDQSGVEARPDVLVYSTPPLDKDTEITGAVMVDLFASSSSADTDFTAKLVDVAPSGFAQNLTEGILRARYRESTREAKSIEPNKVYEYKIDLWSTSNVFLKGHRIRLEISSSNFPRFDRNLNTGKDAGTDQTMIKATNTIFHDDTHRTALILPLVER